MLLAKNMEMLLRKRTKHYSARKALNYATNYTNSYRGVTRDVARAAAQATQQQERENNIVDRDSTPRHRRHPGQKGRIPARPTAGFSEAAVRPEATVNVPPMIPIPRVCISQKRITHFPSHAQILSLAQHLGKHPQKTVQSRIRALQVWDEARRHSPTGAIAETAACLCLYTLKPSTVETYMAKVKAQRPELRRNQDFRKVFDDVIRLSNSIPKRRAFPLGPKQVKTLRGNLSTPEQIMVYQLWTTAGRFGCRKNWAVTYHDEVKAVELRFGPRKGDKKGATLKPPASRAPAR